MEQTFANKILSYIRRWDMNLEARLHRVLPKNVKKRYILGLSICALLVVMAQILEQMALQSQAYTFSQIRLVDAQLNRNQHLLRLLMRTKLSTRQSNLISQFRGIDGLLQDMEQNQALLTDKVNFFQSGSTENSSFSGYYSLTNSTLAKMVVKASELKRTIHDPEKYRFGHLISSSSMLRAVDQLVADSQAFQTSMEQLGKYSEIKMNERMRNTRSMGMAFLFVILLLLAFETLYVFRPAVRQLLDALDARTKFLSTMGHEIRNPMNSILGMTRLLKDTKLSDQQKRYISVLSSSSHSLLGLLNNLIDYSKINAGKVVLQYFEFDLFDQIQDCIDLVTYKIDEKRLNLIYKVDRSLPVKVMSDPVMIQQVLLNLLSNAVKFTERGDITLEVWPEMKEGQMELHFNVADTGIGIRQDKLDEVFEYFRQEETSTLANYGGSGLGLSISAELVRLMGGNIELKSEKGIGTRFHFYIPVKQFGAERFEDFFEKKRLMGNRAFVADGHSEREAVLSSYVTAYGGEVISFSKLEKENHKTRGEWGKYFRENEFDSYILNFDDFAELVDLIAKLQSETRRNFLAKVIVLVRSTLPSSKLVELNSLGIKSFLYLPVKPVEFLNTMDLVLTSKRQMKVVEKKKIDKSVELAKALSVLIVDDSKDNQFLMKSYIEKNASQIVLAGNGVEAIEQFTKEPFDVVFMDILMPEMDGYEATKKIREWEKANNKVPVPIVAVTAHTGEDVLKRCRDAGITAHFSKPVDLSELQSFLVKIFGRKVEQPEVSELQLVWQNKLKEYLPTYYKQREDDIRDLKAAADSKDWGKIMSIGHKIKGNAATYGFPELGEMGADLEKNASKKDLEIVQNRIASMEQWLQGVTQNH